MEHGWMRGFRMDLKHGQTRKVKTFAFRRLRVMISCHGLASNELGEMMPVLRWTDTTQPGYN